MRKTPYLLVLILLITAQGTLWAQHETQVPKVWAKKQQDSLNTINWHKMAANKMNCKDCHLDLAVSSKDLADSSNLDDSLSDLNAAQQGSVRLTLQGRDEIEYRKVPHYYDASADEVFVSDYWIGVSTEKAEAIEAEVKFGDNVVLTQIKTGLKITLVHENSPAAQAGFKNNDVIIEMNDQPVARLEQLARIVDKSKKQPISVAVVRNKQLKLIKVTPAERPEKLTTQAIDASDLARSLAWSYLHANRPSLVASEFIKQLPVDSVVKIEIKKSDDGQRVLGLVVQFHEKEFDLNEDKNVPVPLDKAQKFFQAYYKDSVEYDVELFASPSAQAMDKNTGYSVDLYSNSLILQQILRELQDIKKSLKK